jgi:hypothetical protein
MSETTLTLLIVIAAFACAFGLCEWITRRMSGRNRDDGNSSRS